MGSEGADRNKDKRWQSPGNGPYGEKADMKLWGIFFFGVIGATATTFALARSQSARKGSSGGSFRTAFQEEQCRRYNKRMQEEYEDEMERVERIRRMQNVFNRERNKFRRGCENWREDDAGSYQYHQQFQRDDWYWKADASYRNNNYRESPRQSTPGYALSHHYSILGLDRLRTSPFTEAEIKKAFRAKAMEFHPDQNQNNKEAAEAKFKEVMLSYEAIKKERKDMKL